jgi:hypothetical protein
MVLQSPRPADSQRLLDRLDRLIDAQTRTAEAMEKMAQPVDIDSIKAEDYSVPECPHCNVINPIICKVPTDNESEPGRLLSFALFVTCQHCKADFYGLASWETYAYKEDAITAMKIRAGLMGETNDNHQ